MFEPTGKRATYARRCARRFALGAAALGTGTVALLGVGILAPSIATATSDGGAMWSCSRSATGGTLWGGPVNESYYDGKQTYYTVGVDYWTGTNWAWYGWMHAANGATEASFSDSYGGQLHQPSFSMTVPHGSYAVGYDVWQTGDPTWTWVFPAPVTLGVQSVSASGQLLYGTVCAL